MCERIANGVFGQWFSENIRLAYWLARRTVVRSLVRKGLDTAASNVEELAHDAVCRGFDRFAKRCAKELPSLDNRKRWMCQCVFRGACDATRNRSRFGAVSDRSAIAADAMNRFRRVRPMGRHGTDNEREYLDVEYVPVVPEVQRWEVEELADKWLPKHTRKTAVYAAMGFSQPESALLQDCSERTVRNRMKDIREYLDPSVNIYAVLCSALECARRDRFTPWTTA